MRCGVVTLDQIGGDRREIIVRKPLAVPASLMPRRAEFTAAADVCDDARSTPLSHSLRGRI